MTDQHPENAARKAWSSQPDDHVGVDLTRARQAGAAREAEVRKRDRIAYLCALIIAPSWAAAMWFMPDLRLVAAVGFVVAVWVPSFVYWQSGARLTPDAYATCVTYQQALLQREIAFRLAMPRWYMLPIALSQGAILFGLFTSPRFPQTAMLFWGAAAMMGTAFGVLGVARKRLMREASELRLELNRLNAAVGGDILFDLKGITMKPIRYALVLLLLATTAFAQDAARMEQVIDVHVKNRTFMGAVLVAKGDAVLLSKGYGSANLEWEIPNAPATKFRLGSITKQFTAAAILLLEERGKLSTSDPIKKHMPDAPAAWDAITIHHLLTHTSGIPNLTAMTEFAALKGTATTVDKSIAVFRDKPLDFPAGGKMSYSNSGYIVLGHVIEKLSGGSYEAFVQANIFTPLGMADSGYDSNTGILPRRASGYIWSPDRYTNAGYIHMSVPHAAGALYSTTADLLKWERALFAGKVVSPASLAKMLTPDKNNYAYGVGVQTSNGRKVVGHGGSIDGFNTAMSHYPESGVTVIVLANVNGNTPELISVQLAQLAHGDTVRLPAERKEIPLPAVAATYAGVYEFTPAITMTITHKGGQLFAQLSGQGALPIFAESEKEFFLKVVDAQISFGGEGGAITHLVLHQNGRDQKATRRQP